MVLINKKKSILYLLVLSILLVSCEYNIECKEFNYSELNIDSTQLVNDIVLEDSLKNSYILKFVKAEKMAENGIKTFTDFQYCKNGWINHYSLNGCELKLSYFIQDDSIKICQINCENFSDKLAFKSSDDIYGSFYVGNSCFEKVYLKQGLISGILDANGNKLISVNFNGSGDGSN
jgi:uncharacterized lipoprotein YehR (DUF1307 family)